MIACPLPHLPTPTWPGFKNPSSTHKLCSL